MTGPAPAVAGAGSPIAEWGFGTSSFRLNGAAPTGRNSRGRLVDAAHFWRGTGATIASDQLTVPSTSDDRYLLDLGPVLSKRVVFVFTVNIANGTTGHGFTLGQHYAYGTGSQNFVYQYQGGDGASNQGIRQNNAGSDTQVVAATAGGSGTFTIEIRWFWPVVTLIRNGSQILAPTQLTGVTASLSQGTLFGPRGSGGSPVYSNLEVWAAPLMWRFARNPLG